MSVQVSHMLLRQKVRKTSSVGPREPVVPCLVSQENEDDQYTWIKGLSPSKDALPIIIVVRDVEKPAKIELMITTSSSLDLDGERIPVAICKDVNSLSISSRNGNSESLPRQFRGNQVLASLPCSVSSCRPHGLTSKLNTPCA
jgi:hypothetical protein